MIVTLHRDQVPDVSPRRPAFFDRNFSGGVGATLNLVEEGRIAYEGIALETERDGSIRKTAVNSYHVARLNSRHPCMRDITRANYKNLFTLHRKAAWPPNPNEEKKAKKPKSGIENY